MIKKFIRLALVFFVLFFSSCSNKQSKEITECVKEYAGLELGTVEYSLKRIALFVNDSVRFFWKPRKLGDRKFLFSIEATLTAGIDLSNFDPAKDIKINENNVTLNLPKASILWHSFPPEKIKFEFEGVSSYRSDFNVREINEIQKQCENSILRDEFIKKLGILKDAETNAKNYFQSVLSMMGFENIRINFE